MRIEIFVVKTEINRLVYPEETTTSLEVIKSEIVHEFGGMTKIPHCKGYWEEPTKFHTDDVEIWLIYTNSKDAREIIESFAKRIKNLTYQKEQAFAIDGNLYLI
jgi:hypothetical protein